jgi:hypothetical protein
MSPVARLHEIAAELCGDSAGGEAGLVDDELLELMAAYEVVGRAVAARQVRLAGEVGVRSRSELGDEGLSRSQNFTTPVALVAKVTGASARACKARLELGRTLRGAVLLGGGEGPAPFPVIARVLDEGVLGVEAASAIV